MRAQELSFKQTSVLFDLRGGAGVVSGWERRYDEGGLKALEPKPRGRPSKMKPLKTPKTSAIPRRAKTPNTHEPGSEQAQEPVTLEALRRC
jgi:transposase